MVSVDNSEDAQPRVVISEMRIDNDGSTISRSRRTMRRAV